jgi:hypothetical protein
MAQILFHPFRQGGALATFLMTAVTAGALVVNDGTSTNALRQLANAENVLSGETTLAIDLAGVLLAQQSGDAYPPLRTVWYAVNASPTTGVYRVAADFRPAATEARRQGGVMGWVNLATRQGLAFYVVAAGSDPSFRVGAVDFTAAEPETNESLAHLYNLDAEYSAATETVTSAWAELGAQYTPTNLATFELLFAAPTPADLAKVTNATARVTARVYQGSEAGGTPIPVSRAIELLTTLPLPDAEAHRFGYYAVWRDTFSVGRAIGELDNLIAEGSVGIPPNQPPSITLTNPVSGTVLSAPATLTLEAEASDRDGSIRQVEFLSGGVPLGTVAESPYSWTLSDLAAGSYAFTARAVDDLGAITTSAPVQVTVTGSSGEAPRMTLVVVGDELEISWLTAGYQLQASTNVATGVWTDVQPSTVGLTKVRVPVSSTLTFYRLVGGSVPTGPTLAIVSVGEEVELSWSMAGYQLQTSASLGSGGWTEVAVNTVNLTRIRLPRSAANAFFRLVSGGSVPATPSLAIGLSGGQAVVSWPAQVTGYRLQSKPSLSAAAWTDVATSGNRHSESAANGTKFYRLVNP